MTHGEPCSLKFTLSNATPWFVALVALVVSFFVPFDARAEPQPSREAPVGSGAQVEPLDGVAGVEPSGSKPDAGAVAEAEVWAEQGRDAAKREDFEAAYKAFREAFQRSRHYTLAGSLAVVEMKLGLYADAAVHWEIFLRHLNDAASEKRAAVLAQLEACRKRLGRVDVRTNAPGAVLVVDGKVMGPLPRDVWLAPGPHGFTARLDSRASEAQVVDVTAGLDEMVTVNLPESTALPPTPSTEAAQRADSERVPSSSEPAGATEESGIGAREYVAIAGAVLTVAGLATGGVGLWLASERSDEADTLSRRLDQTAAENAVEPDTICAAGMRNRPEECAQLRDALWRRDRMETLAAVALTSAASVALATSITYWLWPAAAEAAARVHGLGTTARPFGPAVVAPWATASSTGIALSLPWP